MADRPPVHDPFGTAMAGVMALLGCGVIWQARGFTTLGKVFPLAIAGAMVVLCLALVARNVIAGRRVSALADPRDGDEPAADEAGNAFAGSNWRRIALLVVMGVWIALLPVLGFYAASLVGFLATMLVAIHERITWREGVVLAVAAAVFPLGFWLLMVEVLRIPVPRGLLL